MVMVDDIVPFLGPEYDRDQVCRKEPVPLFSLARVPALAALLHLAHADGHLGGAQISQRNGLENGFANQCHGPTLLPDESSMPATNINRNGPARAIRGLAGPGLAQDIIAGL